MSRQSWHQPLIGEATIIWTAFYRSYGLRYAGTQQQRSYDLSSSLCCLDALDDRQEFFNSKYPDQSDAFLRADDVMRMDELIGILGLVDDRVSDDDAMKDDDNDKRRFSVWCFVA